MDWLTESKRLHAGVRRFALEGVGDFEQLALEIAHFQARHSPGFARLVQSHGGRLDRLERIPAVPSAAFRLTRVAVHPREFDVACFVTSGTTDSDRGRHCFRTLETYEALALQGGRAALLPKTATRAVVVLLAPEPSSPMTSSLGFMLQLFLEHFEGITPTSPGFSERWLVRGDELALPDLERAAQHAAEAGLPLLILATSFALAALLEALATRPIAFPKSTCIMETGGFKGKVLQLEPAALKAQLMRTFGIPAQQIIGEYGMTELTSQLYSSELPGAALQSAPGVYSEPAWLRIQPVDATTLEAVAVGEVGIARIIDLGSIDSAVAVLTEDRVRRVAGGIELLGRQAGAPARGCSLSVETLLDLKAGAAPPRVHGG